MENKDNDSQEEKTKKTDRNKKDRKKSPEKDDHPAIFDISTVEDIITGLRKTILERSDFSKEDHILTPIDYTYSYQFIMNMKSGSHRLLKFKDFAPKVFYQIRDYFGVNDEDYLKSFEMDNLKAIKGEGKSGAFFIFTKDNQFILKTASQEERDFLWQILPDYLMHIKDNPDTLLPRYYGVYSMKHEGIGGVVRFVIMQNIFCTPYAPEEKYDLKGSSFGRSVPEDKRKSGVILKDLDIKETDRKFWIPKDVRELFITQLILDSKFLATHKIMDYSLLVGIYYKTEENEKDTKLREKKFKKHIIWNKVKRSKWMIDNGGIIGRNDERERDELYHFGIIDILIKYETKKKNGASF